MKDPQGDMETVSINSIFWNNKQSSIMANLKTTADNNTITVPYKIDTGSEGNSMPLYIYKKIVQTGSKTTFTKSIKNIKLKTYNSKEIPQLGTCAVQIEFKNVTKHYVFFVVLGNSQALLGIPDTMVLNIINVNFDSIQAE